MNADSDLQYIINQLTPKDSIPDSIPVENRPVSFDDKLKECYERYNEDGGSK